MKKTSATFALLFLGMTFALTGISDVEAKRFGGARSFGGKSSYSSPFRRSTTSKSTRSASQQKASKQNQTARQNMSRRGGFMGILGGLALGGLLGSLFFGGAFESLNFMDILIFGGIAFLLLKLFAGKTQPKRQTAYNTNSYNLSDKYSSPYSHEHSANFETDHLFKQKNNSQTFPDKDDQADAEFDADVIPPGFVESAFLTGAKGAFKDLQKAWDNHDLAGIRDLTTDKVFAEIQDQLNTSTETNQTELLKIDAELLSIREIASELEAVVLFDTIMREDTDSQAEQIREIWHFIKQKNSTQPKWYLDGIQQLEH